MLKHLTILLLAVGPAVLAQERPPTVEERLTRVEALLQRTQQANQELEARVEALQQELAQRDEEAATSLLLRDRMFLEGLARQDAFRELLAEELVKSDLRGLARAVVGNDALQRAVEEHLVRSRRLHTPFGVALWQAGVLQEQLLKDDRFLAELAEELAEDRTRRLLAEELLDDDRFLRALAEESDFVGRLADNDRFVRALADNDVFVRCLKDALD